MRPEENPDGNLEGRDTFSFDPMPGPVLFYNDWVIDHFTNPRNVGDLQEEVANGFGLVTDDDVKRAVPLVSETVQRLRSISSVGA